MKRQCHFTVIINAEKITIKHWELDLFFYFTFYLFGGAYAPNAPEMDVCPFFFTQPNPTHQFMDPTQPTHHTNADTSTVEPIFYMSFISQLCLLKNEGKRMSISVIPVYCSGSKKRKKLRVKNNIRPKCEN